MAYIIESGEVAEGSVVQIGSECYIVVGPAEEEPNASAEQIFDSCEECAGGSKAPSQEPSSESSGDGRVYICYKTFLYIDLATCLANGAYEIGYDCGYRIGSQYYYDNSPIPHPPLGLCWEDGFGQAWKFRIIAEYATMAECTANCGVAIDPDPSEEPPGSGTGGGGGPGTGSGSGEESGAGSDAGSGAGSGAGSEAGSEAGSTAGSTAGSEAGSEAGSTTPPSGDILGSDSSAGQGGASSAAPETVACGGCNPALLKTYTVTISNADDLGPNFAFMNGTHQVTEGVAFSCVWSKIFTNPNGDGLDWNLDLSFEVYGDWAIEMYDETLTDYWVMVWTEHGGYCGNPVGGPYDDTPTPFAYVS